MKGINSNMMVGWHTIVNPFEMENGPEVPLKGYIHEQIDVIREGAFLKKAVINRVFRLDDQKLLLEKDKQLSIGTGRQRIDWTYFSLKDSFSSMLTDAGLHNWGQWILARLIPFQPLCEIALNHLISSNAIPNPVTQLISVGFTVKKTDYSLNLGELTHPDKQKVWGFGLTQYE